jgi:hypothetical protein
LGKGEECRLELGKGYLGRDPGDERRCWNGENIWGVVEKGNVDMLAFGRWFIANPDMPERLVS